MRTAAAGGSTDLGAAASDTEVCGCEAMLPLVHCKEVAAAAASWTRLPGQCSAALASRGRWRLARHDRVAAVTPSHSHPPTQVAGCDKDISTDKQYYRRHRICPRHLNANAIGSSLQRFCQQCSAFQPVGDFDDNKR